MGSKATTVYFIRHAQADNSVSDGRMRPLTKKGADDTSLVDQFLQDKGIDLIFSSPYKRSVDTLATFAQKNCLEIELVEDFRERKSDSDWDRKNDFIPFFKRQWADFSYTLSDGESLSEVQARNISALKVILAENAGKNIVIGTHGIALSTIINYYDNTYGLEDFAAMAPITPWVAKMEFDGDCCSGIEKIDLFSV